MTAKYRIDTTIDRKYLDLFLNPTNCLYSDFENRFGKEIADSNARGI